MFHNQGVQSCAICVPIKEWILFTSIERTEIYFYATTVECIHSFETQKSRCCGSWFLRQGCPNNLKFHYSRYDLNIIVFHLKFILICSIITMHEHVCLHSRMNKHWQTRYI